MTFGEDLRAARIAAGMSQGQLTEATGLGPTAISNYENGRYGARPDTVAKLEAALGVSLQGEDPPVAEEGQPAEPSKDKPPTPKKATGAKKAAAPKATGMPPLRLQLEMPYRLGATALAGRMPHTAGILAQQAGPCAAAWDTFLLRYPALREKIEQGAVAADIVNLIMAHVPIIQVAREEIAAQQAAAAAFATDRSQAA